MRLTSALLAAVFAMAALPVPLAAQDSVQPAKKANALCAFHGPGCDAAPADWTWQRLGAANGGFTIEVPCDSAQADSFGQIVAMSRAKFPPGSTRACMKDSSGFVATMIGFAGAPPEESIKAETDTMMNGSPDLFSALVGRTRASTADETTFKGRRALANTIEKPDRRTRVMLVEVGTYGVIMLTADINPDFPGTREEADAAVERFIQSLEIAA